MNNTQTAQIEKHAIARMTERLASVLDQNDQTKIEQVAKEFGGRRGKYYVEVKNFGGRKIHLEDRENNNINGDVIVAVLKDGILKTVMLAKSWRSEYFSDGRYIKA